MGNERSSEEIARDFVCAWLEGGGQGLPLGDTDKMVGKIVDIYKKMLKTIKDERGETK